ncbi:hypothetical protein BJ508DRAFT_366157 [Ascobolus immersus RN42]|uniref:J domain-containing protein n=1 Tax=Ascobolus immersus RN42 TaxID=1160509 RepID=A0A3N4HS19_ASCIM|nr:hypothetical protein BJ508DRAFT_366157 [Ascobolus immersus RN42]
MINMIKQFHFFAFLLASLGNCVPVHLTSGTPVDRTSLNGVRAHLTNLAKDIPGHINSLVKAIPPRVPGWQAIGGSAFNVDSFNPDPISLPDLSFLSADWQVHGGVPVNVDSFKDDDRSPAHLIAAAPIDAAKWVLHNTPTDVWVGLFWLWLMQKFHPQAGMNGWDSLGEDWVWVGPSDLGGDDGGGAEVVGTTGADGPGVMIIGDAEPAVTLDAMGTERVSPYWQGPNVQEPVVQDSVIQEPVARVPVVQQPVAEADVQPAVTQNNGLAVDQPEALHAPSSYKYARLPKRPAFVGEDPSGYLTLGLPETASWYEIKDQYTDLYDHTHPRRHRRPPVTSELSNGEGSSVDWEKEFDQVNRAADLLIAPRLRKEQAERTALEKASELAVKAAETEELNKKMAELERKREEKPAMRKKVPFGLTNLRFVD